MCEIPTKMKHYEQYYEGKSKGKKCYFSSEGLTP